MKGIFRGFAVLVLLLTGATAHAFTSGSTGADGAFSPAANVEVQLPENGILNYTTVNIPAGVTVTFRKNSANTPIYILATGDVSISGTISVNGTDAINITPGKGGPGGFDGGTGGWQDKGGNGLGPGGGVISSQASNSGYNQGGGGGYGTEGGRYNTYSGAGGSTYGNDRLIPLIGGSGGAGGNIYATYPGGGGGGASGAIFIASSGEINVTGSILANGGKGAPGTINNYNSGGGGSGGAIKLIATTISGNGTISAVGGAGGSTTANKGGNGRIRLEADTITRTAATVPYHTYSEPGPVFIADTPAIRITSIDGIQVPENPTASYGMPDIMLAAGTVNPVQIGLSASNIPTGTAITVSVVPQLGATSSYTSTGLSGPRQSSTATASVNLSSDQACVIMAYTTFNIQTAMYYEGEKIDKVMVASTVGKGSEVTYITEHGRQVSSRALMAKATMN